MDLNNDNIRILEFRNSTYRFLQISSLGHGGCIWDGAIVLTKFFERNFDKLNEKYQFKGKSIMELGSGTGFCGIGFSEFSPTVVCLTDLKELKSLMEENLNINKHLISCEMMVEELIWGKNYQDQLEKIWNKKTNGFDFLIGSDLIDSSGKYLEDLLETLIFCFERNPNLIMFHCYTMHKKITVDKFLQILKREKFEYEEIEEKDMDEEYKSDDIGIIIIRKISSNSSNL